MKIKRNEIKFETAKDFLIGNRNLVFQSLNTAFFQDKFDLKELATDYFNFIQSSKYNDYFGDSKKRN